MQKEQWVNAISKYTNGTYTAADVIVVEDTALIGLVDMLKNESVGMRGLRYLVAWSIYRQLVTYTLPSTLAKGRPASDACYEHASKAMYLALVGSYYQTDAFREEFESSSWVTGDDRRVVVQKLANMRTYVGSPGGRLEDDFVEKFYSEY
ncbi:hypothetical protein HPB52_018145 [Rhipicephalus sanguineus]|uniref:Uncharacterized protein n=1 Tax=Rhipicephalus sanguineus TaxID=34632 RepID=A0A9D4SXN0_RHISA|nr:hypothetical protein HPB52_018145 [Rhipicephalus sanguineus]